MTSALTSKQAMTRLIALRDDGHRLAALIGDGDVASGLVLHVVMTAPDGYQIIDVQLGAGQHDYPSLTPAFPGAAWYERRLYDLYGVVPDGHPRVDPLILPRAPDVPPPSPGSTAGSTREPEYHQPDESGLPQGAHGPGVFTIPYGPVRGGVTESVEYLVETPGEDILRLGVRAHAKHRGVETRFQGMNVEDGVLLAERVEGIASVAHALAFCHAVERVCDTTVSTTAQLIRVLHAELERIANHLDVALKAADGAALAVAVARFGWHKERVLRLVCSLCGNRFGRGVVVPGGVAPDWCPDGLPGGLGTELTRLRREIDRDARSLMNTASFLDRMRTAGPLRPEDARAHGTLGPVARGSGYDDDTRWHRPYGAYCSLEPHRGPHRDAGDALARLQVRWDEVAESFDLIDQVLEALPQANGPLQADLHPAAGLAVGAAEAPQGEVLYLVRLSDDGRLLRCAPRSASLVNLSVFPLTFVGDIFTDFVFNEASFGVSIAGVAM